MCEIAACSAPDRQDCDSWAERCGRACKSLSLASNLRRSLLPHPSQVFSLKNGNRGRDGKVASARANEAFSYAGG